MDPKDQAGGSSQPETVAGSGENQGGGELGKAATPNQPPYVTREVLKGITDHLNRKFSEDLKGTSESLKKEIGELVKTTIAETLRLQTEAANPEKGKKGGQDATELELSRLKAKLEEHERLSGDLRKNLDSEREQARNYRKRAKVIEALRRQDCIRPDVTYRTIEEHLQLAEDGETVFAVSKNEFGAEEKIPLDDFIKKQVREEIIPELFKGANRGGSPASGDTGANGAWKFTEEQIRDPAFYRANADEIRKAIDLKQVRPAVGARR